MRGRFPLLRGSAALAAMFLFVASATLVAADHVVTSSAAPTGGPWKGSSPGAFVVFQSKAWDTGAVFRRELLLGLDADGKALIAMSKGASAEGPWTDTTTQRRDGTDAAPIEPAPLGRRTLTVQDQPVVCEGTRFLERTPSGMNTVERWTDVATGRRVRSVTVTASGNLIEDTLQSVASLPIGDATVDAAVYLSTTTRNGQISMSRRTAFSDDVPGRRVAYARWVGETEPVGARYAVDETVVAMGKDADAVAALAKGVPATQPATAPSPER